MKRKLETTTLLGIDCVDIDRLIVAAEICQQAFDFAEVKLLTSLPSNNSNIILIPPVDSIEEYSRFMIEELDAYVETPHVLVIQYDGFILNPSAWTDEFLAYDYIGAPWFVDRWAVGKFGLSEDLIGTSIVGNGGFSLRSKKFLSLCAELSREHALEKLHPEDAALCVWNRELLEARGARFAPVALAKQFSFERITNDHTKWDEQFGFHGFRWSDITKWQAEHPEYEINAELKTIRHG